MIYQLLIKRADAIPLASSHIAHLRNQFDYDFALLNFYGMFW